MSLFYDPAERPEVYQQIKSLLTELKIPFADADPTTPCVISPDFAELFSWDGEKLTVSGPGHIILHDAAHYLIAPEKNRAHHHFGLMIGPQHKAIENYQESQRQEEMARVLGVMFQLSIGHDPSRMLRIMKKHTKLPTENTVHDLELEGLLDLPCLRSISPDDVYYELQIIKDYEAMV